MIKAVYFNAGHLNPADLLHQMQPFIQETFATPGCKIDDIVLRLEDDQFWCGTVYYTQNER